MRKFLQTRLGTLLVVLPAFLVAGALKLHFATLWFGLGIAAYFIHGWENWRVPMSAKAPAVAATIAFLIWLLAPPEGEWHLVSMLGLGFVCGYCVHRFLLAAVGERPRTE